MTKQTKKHWYDKALTEDLKYFEKQVEKGVKRLAGAKTKERVRNCCHCKVWNKSDKFIRNILEETK